MSSRKKQRKFKPRRFHPRPGAPPHAVAHHRRGIALRPETYDGDSLFKVPFPKVARHEFPAGRGIFVENGRFVPVYLPSR